MPKKPLLLDLFCKAGGCSVGYARAGFDVVGVDIEPQKNYPFPFVEDDALELLRCLLRGGKFHIAPSGPTYCLEDIAAIHASPPCQAYSSTRFLNGFDRSKHQDLLDPVRQLLLKTDCAWIIENVEGAPMQAPSIRLCGLSFGLKVFRHRWFESNRFLFQPQHIPHGLRRIGRDGFCCVVGNGGNCRSAWNNGLRTPPDHRTKKAWSDAMGIDWMTRQELSQAIPPAYTEFIGRQLVDLIHGQKESAAAAAESAG